MSAWLFIIGIGEDGLDGLSSAARDRLKGAEILVGGARHLAMIPEDGRQRIAWPSPFSALVETLTALKPRPVAVLATGDPLWFGVGAKLARQFPIDELCVLPSPSAFSLAAARLGWSLADVATITLHGRPAAMIEPHIQPRARVLILAGGGETPRQVAARLVARGFGSSVVHVLEHMGGPEEHHHTATASQIAAPGAAREFASFNTIAVECHAGPQASRWPQITGLADNAFIHDGQITRAVVRAATLSRLAPFPGALLWDLGAGAGSVAIEWMRASAWTRAVAVEKNPVRAANIRQNAQALGTPMLEVLEADIHECLDGLERPDAIFIGGGLTGDAAGKTIDDCQQALPAGGCLVANAVTLASEQCLFDVQARHGGELTRIAVSHAASLGAQQVFRPALPVTQWAYVKPAGTDT